eukprot:Hpha_TRINITY_DN19829_c0_g1::TRINITY_DN19829_c0_g1_i1::g.132106::m.132106
MLRRGVRLLTLQFRQEGVEGKRQGTVLWTLPRREGESPEALAARQDGVVESVAGLRGHSRGDLRCIVACGGVQIGSGVEGRLRALGAEVLVGPSLEEEAEQLAPGSGKYAKDMPQLYRWLAVRRLGTRPGSCPVLSVDHTARFSADIAPLLSQKGPGSAAGLDASPIVGLSNLARAVEAQPARLRHASGDEGCVLFYPRWWKGAEPPPMKPGDGESAKWISKQDEMLRGLIIVALALSIGCVEGDATVFHD